MRMSRRICTSTGTFGEHSFSYSGGNGSYRFFSDGDGEWHIEFYISGKLTVYDSAIIDIHLVGGGGSGSGGSPEPFVFFLVDIK